MARQKDSLSLSAKKIRRRARFFLSLSSFSAPNAAKRVADAISILTQRMKKSRRPGGRRPKIVFFLLLLLLLLLLLSSFISVIFNRHEQKSFCLTTYF